MSTLMNKEAMAFEVTKMFIEFDDETKKAAADQIAERLGADHPVVLQMRRIIARSNH